ncbi:hypothetical protein AB32_0077 [Escherichia coli 2-316-03_S1_C2]|nr:hypothetical protein PPECC33_00045 [Escherichia coli PCN033]AVJ69718.1 hypothetical protein CSC09_0840 [Escherichia coli]EFF03044.1 predicted protein [Escherichia coli FVEC1412]EFI22478.1 predicted protein [Escherichia coli FVEC1302]EFJ71469.1 hypothetical protein HMPREF9552_04959 [Escherichia coli MS 198-1]EGI42763.1 conserved hypothetical protein [Escherichia coli TA280]EIH11144.1 hypothetical protein EC990741_0045 [Escherichia coli 97.0259]ESA65650.1 hypothetical protein HMPREF1588_044
MGIQLAAFCDVSHSFLSGKNRASLCKYSLFINVMSLIVSKKIASDFQYW